MTVNLSLTGVMMITFNVKDFVVYTFLCNSRILAIPENKYTLKVTFIIAFRGIYT